MEKEERAGDAVAFGMFWQIGNMKEEKAIVFGRGPWRFWVAVFWVGCSIRTIGQYLWEDGMGRVQGTEESLRIRNGCGRDWRRCRISCGRRIFCNAQSFCEIHPGDDRCSVVFIAKVPASLLSEDLVPSIHMCCEYVQACLQTQATYSRTPLCFRIARYPSQTPSSRTNTPELESYSANSRSSSDTPLSR